MRRLLLLVSAIVLVDTMFFAAITPLLPFYSDRYDLPKAAAGALTAAYPLGTLLMALPAGWIAARFGSRRVAICGLALMATASLAFGFAESAGLLAGARFVQGVGSALSWAAGLAWLVNGSPAERRGEVLGTAFGAAIGGVLLGPVVGAAAREVGTGPMFTAIALLNVALMLAALRTPSTGRGAPSRARDMFEPLRDRRAATGAGLIVLVGTFFGVVEVLAPLRLDELGAGGFVIAAAFLLDSAVQAVAGRAFGKWIDRRGPQIAIRVGLAAGCLLAIAFPLPQSIAVLFAVIVLSGPAVGVLWLPGMTLLSEGTERRGVDQAYAFGLLNLAWAGAALTGSALGSAMADATSDAVPYAGLAVMFGAALVYSVRATMRTRVRAER